MDWTFFYLMVFLKLPILALFGIVWWAIKADPDAGTDDADSSEGGGGGSKRPREPFGPRPRSRGPHGDPHLPAPPRTRPVTAKGRRLTERPRSGSR